MDAEIRLAAFEWLQQQSMQYGGILPRALLAKGFPFRSEYITLVGPKGIWKPKAMQLPLSITTVSSSSYDDDLGEGNMLKYRYRGTDPYHQDNVGLRELMVHRIPLIYFHSPIKGDYVPAWPVFILSDDISNLTFTIAVDAQDSLTPDLAGYAAREDPQSYGRRSYLTTKYRIRLHQSAFRIRILRAYQNQCSMCRLKHVELLDAAHIIQDKHELGEPIVQNGLALCKIHHAAFDSNILGVTPDYVIKVRDDVLHEIDGPMLRHGLQSLDNSKIALPSRRAEWPDMARLEMRYGAFLNA
jgi:putative restriction endonuclease